MSSGFDRLSAALQYQIVNTFRFESLRPVQEQAIDAILGGSNCVVLAPTAGGKTESAFFPLLSEMDTQDWRPVSVLYVAPIRALLNNQEPRLTRYAQSIGRRVFKWHGDVASSQRRKFVDDPSDILLTTPESLEVMLMSARIPAKRLFQTLRAVVIDEVHAFVGDDRGGHLSALMERLSRVCGHDVQRIGLSATVGNPDEILRWAAGSSQRAGRIVWPSPTRAEPELSLDYVANLENAARVIAALHPGKKRLVFVDSAADHGARDLSTREITCPPPGPGAGSQFMAAHRWTAVDPSEQFKTQNTTWAKARWQTASSWSRVGRDRPAARRIRLPRREVRTRSQADVRTIETTWRPHTDAPCMQGMDSPTDLARSEPWPGLQIQKPARAIGHAAIARAPAITCARMGAACP